MSVLSRSALESSPLADLHEIASELGVDGFRRLRKADLVAAILARQGGDAGEPDAAAGDDGAAEPQADTREDGAASEDDAAEESRPRRARSRRGGGRGRTRDADQGDDGPGADADEQGSDAGAGRGGDAEPAERKPARAARSGRGRRGSAASSAAASQGGGTDEDAGDATAEGTVELLGNGSGFVRVSPPEPSDDDVYISAAQVRRCELVTGDTVTGPVRPPRRSERYPSLVRIDTINGRSADEVSEGTHFDDLPAAFPTERFALGGEDPTLKAIQWLTPIGRGSRVTITGPARSGKSEALRRLAAALAEVEGVELSVVLAGVRPEEIADWADREPVATTTLAVSAEAQGQAVERAIDTAKRIAARGGHAVVLVDALGSVPAAVARKALAAARTIVDGGSLTVVATADEPIGGETTSIVLDRALTSTGRFPAVDLVASGTLRPELLVGEAGADVIAQAHAAALG